MPWFDEKTSTRIKSALDGSIRAWKRGGENGANKVFRMALITVGNCPVVMSDIVVMGRNAVMWVRMTGGATFPCGPQGKREGARVFGLTHTSLIHKYMRCGDPKDSFPCSLRHISKIRRRRKCFFGDFLRGFRPLVSRASVPEGSPHTTGATHLGGMV